MTNILKSFRAFYGYWRVTLHYKLGGAYVRVVYLLLVFIVMLLYCLYMKIMGVAIPIVRAPKSDIVRVPAQTGLSGELSGSEVSSGDSAFVQESTETRRVPRSFFGRSNTVLLGLLSLILVLGGVFYMGGGNVLGVDGFHHFFGGDGGQGPGGFPEPQQPGQGCARVQEANIAQAPQILALTYYPTLLLVPRQEVAATTAFHLGQLQGVLAIPAVALWEAQQPVMPLMLE